MKPCPDCNEPRGGRYQHAGASVCWPRWMKRTGLDPLPARTAPPDPKWVTYRKRILDRLWALSEDRFISVDENTVLGQCPLCRTGAVTVIFHGTTTRADLACSLGCSELDIAAALMEPRMVR